MSMYVYGIIQTGQQATYCEKHDMQFTLSRKLWWQLLNSNYQEMYDLCHFDASYLWEEWIDLHEEFLEV